MPQVLAPASIAASPPSREPSKIQAVGIVVLARDHRETIGRCIAGLFAANSYCGWRNSLWIVIVADSCTDDTAKVARDALGAFGQVVQICAHSTQAAHELGASLLMEHFRDVPRHSLLLTSTAATAELPRNWIDLQLKVSRSPVGLSANQTGSHCPAGRAG